MGLKNEQLIMLDAHAKTTLRCHCSTGRNAAKTFPFSHVERFM